ncbi:MAG TPA: rhodanese-like domain-containing protein [Gemmatirosa sp.]
MDHTPGFVRFVDAVRPRVREIPVATALARMAAGARLLDVREDGEWALGHAAGAEHLGRGVLERDIETRVPDPDTELLLYCGGGYRSALAADTLQRMGYTNVSSVEGGWRGWHAAGAPIVGAPPEPEPAASQPVAPRPAAPPPAPAAP